MSKLTIKRVSSFEPESLNVVQDDKEYLFKIKEDDAEEKCLAYLLRQGKSLPYERTLDGKFSLL